MARSPFVWLPAWDLKDDLLYDYFRELEDIAKLEDPEDRSSHPFWR